MNEIILMVGALVFIAYIPSATVSRHLNQVIKLTL